MVGSSWNENGGLTQRQGQAGRDLRSYDGRVTEPTKSQPRPRVRWVWIIGCIALGFTGITAGFLLVAPESRTAYVASVLAGVGTTLLLVGVVVLLERRIIDTAATAVRRAVDAQWEANDARIQRLTSDLEDRLTAEWSQSDRPDAEAMRRRTDELTDELVETVVDEANELAEDTKRDAD